MKQPDQLAAHLAYFVELGVTGVSRDPSWRIRPADEGTPPAPAHSAEPLLTAQPEAQASTQRTLTGAARRDKESAKESAVEAATSGVSMFDQIAVPEMTSAEERLKFVRRELGDCTRCKLHTKRTTLVFGVGNPDAELMFVGEAPGRDEDLQGIPFVGRAGQLLTKIIESIALSRDDVYIANVIKCRPPDNRNPSPDEVRTCEPFLFAQVDSIKPRVIVALGAFAVRTLLRKDEAISKVRGRVYDYRGAKLIPTFHPAFLLRSPDRKRDVWEDMKKVRAILQGGKPESGRAAIDRRPSTAD